MIEADKQNAENEKKRQELKHAYRRLFKTGDGKMVKEDLERFCGFFKTSTNADWNPYHVMFAEGKRRVYLRLHSMITKEEKKND